MNPIAHKYGASPLPGVNLIPSEIAERKKMRAVVTTAVVVVAIAVAVVALGFATAFVAKLTVESDRDAAMQDEAAAVAGRDGKAPVYDDVRAREQQEFTLAQVGFGEIDYAQLAASIQGTANADTSFDEIVLTGPNGEGIPVEAVEGAAFGPGVGTLEFLARATSLEAANDLISRLEAVPGLANVRGMTDSVGSDGAETYWQVEGTAALTDLLLTDRLLPTGGISGVGDVLAPIVEPSPDASATPSPEPTSAEEG